MSLVDSRPILTKLVLALALALAFALVPQSLRAQGTPVEEAVAEANAQGAEAQAESSETAVADPATAYTPLGPDMIKGRPVSAEEDFVGSMNFQPQHNADGRYALWMNSAILTPVIVVISLFVLALLMWVVFRYRRAANPVASKTSHNTLIEVIWTLVPVIILVVIAVPSISLLASQYKTPPEDAITVKAIGYQWYWGYEYVDNGGFEVISNMMDESEALDAGLPPQLAVDNRMVLPVGVPIRLQTTGADVIHSFAVPSLWFKLDAVPGRLNERMLTIDEPGIYYGQCSELCGARHGYMPIAIEAVPLEDYRRWVLSQPGGSFGEPDETAAEEDAQSAEDAAEAGDIEGEAAAETAEAAAS